MIAKGQGCGDLGGGALHVSTSGEPAPLKASQAWKRFSPGLNSASELAPGLCCLIYGSLQHSQPGAVSDRPLNVAEGQMVPLMDCMDQLRQAHWGQFRCPARSRATATDHMVLETLYRAQPQAVLLILQRSSLLRKLTQDLNACLVARPPPQLRIQFHSF